MSIRSRLRKLENDPNRQTECTCSGMLIVKEIGETSWLCPSCVKRAQTVGTIVILPSLENISAEIPTRGKIYAGFDADRV